MVIDRIELINAFNYNGWKRNWSDNFNKTLKEFISSQLTVVIDGIVVAN
jgi:hypothetical protein